MNASRETGVRWPDPIYYVCNSGAGIVVNAAPLVQAAGAHRKIVGMRILCGVRDRKNLTDTERRESIRPAERLTKFASEQLGIMCVDRIYGSPDSYAAWSDALNDSAERAEELGATLVYNVTGGPRTVPLASILGASDAARASIMMIAVSFGDRTCTQLVFDAGGALTDERALPASGRIGFDGLVTLYGYREQDPGSRKDHEAFIAKHGDIARNVLEEIRSLTRGRKSAIAALHRSMQFDCNGKERGEHFAPFRVEWKDLQAPPPHALHREPPPSNALRRVLRAFHGVDGLDIIRGATGNVERIEINSEAARRFCGGVWLEAVVYGLVRDVFNKSAKAQIVAGATLAVEDKPPRSSNVLPDDMELDVAIEIDDQLHVIEVKAVTTSRDFGEHIAKLVKIRQELGSQVMSVYLVAPLLNKGDLERGGFSSRARKQGVTLLYGLPRQAKTGGVFQLLKERLKKLG